MSKYYIDELGESDPIDITKHENRFFATLERYVEIAKQND